MAKPTDWLVRISERKKNAGLIHGKRIKAHILKIGEEVKSPVFDKKAYYIHIQSEEGCYYEIGKNPRATKNSEFLYGEFQEIVERGDSISVISAELAQKHMDDDNVLLINPKE